MSIYSSTKKITQSKYAIYIFAFLAYIESIFFPVPLDIALVPLVASRPKSYLFIAILATICSVAGGASALLLGKFAMDSLTPFLSIETVNYVQSQKLWFESFGIYMVLTAGFTPIPYKIISLTAGVCNFSLTTFVFASMFSRGLRFYLVSRFSSKLSALNTNTLYYYADLTGWACIFAFYLAFIL